MESTDQPPGQAAHRRTGSAIGWLCVAVLSALAVSSALWSVVLLPPTVDSSLAPRIAASLLLAGPGLYYITLYAGRVVPSRPAPLAPALCWLAAVVVISAGRPEGDNAYLLASYQGLLLAPLGMAAAAVGIIRSRSTQWPPG